MEISHTLLPLHELFTGVSVLGDERHFAHFYTCTEDHMQVDHHHLFLRIILNVIVINFF